MNAGLLRYYITVKPLVTVTDTGGGSSVSWSAGSSCWAYLRPARFYGAIIADKDATVGEFEVTIRNGAITTPHRGDHIEYSGRVFDIETVGFPDKGFITIKCRELS